MRKEEYNTQIGLYKGLKYDKERICGKFEFTYSTIKYVLFGEYYPKTDRMEWSLFKYKDDELQGRIPNPTGNLKTPISILKLMMKVERLVTKEWCELHDNIWHNEEV